MGQEWFHAIQGVLGLCELSIHSGQLSLSLFQDESVILRVDFEKHVAFPYRLVVLHIQLDGLTTHARRNAHHIGSRCCIIGPWMALDYSPDVERDQHRTGDDDYGDNLANELAALDSFIR